jgi:hypothetical protein
MTSQDFQRTFIKNNATLVTLYIEYNPVICYDTRITIDRFQFVKISEICL